EARLVRISVEAEIVNGGDARLFETECDEAGQIEHCTARERRRHEKFLEGGVCVAKAIDEFGADFIARLADERADGGSDVLAARAEFFHLCNGRLDDAV